MSRERGQVEVTVVIPVIKMDTFEWFGMSKDDRAEMIGEHIAGSRFSVEVKTVKK